VPHTTLISTDTLASHLQAGWVIADCRYDLQRGDWGHGEYLAAHVPGASYVSLSHHLAGPPNGTNGRHPLPSHEALVDVFSRLGIGEQTQVVAYDQDSGMYAARLWWLLRYAGHTSVAVLDGGFAKWTAEGRPTRAGEESRPAAAFTADWQSQMQLDVNSVMAVSRVPATLLLDARSPERYEGQVEPIDRVPGHIPNAANHFYKSNMAPDNSMLPADRLRAQFEVSLRGHTPGQTVMYCGSGVTACHNLLAMEHAGLSGARLYVGSWSEWSADPQRPVETGPSRR
jgi:thiosulfate/3-mercaptopyruvate sulfurtransferase